jgi:undecaprenyl-diphosphatase
MQAPTTFQAIILGLVQGITEFLPISSTAHLRVVPALLGWDDPGAAFTAVIQLGTLAATIVYFRTDLWNLTVGALKAIGDGKPFETHDSRLAFGIVIGTIPIGVLGLAFKHLIEGELRSLVVVSTALIVLAIVLFIAERTARHARDFSQMTFLDAFLIGCGQTCALIPGCSRSGSTITAALFLGLKRDTAARFSFILGIPAVGAAGLWELKSIVKHHELGSALIGPTVIASVVAFVSGLGAIAFLVRFLQRNSTVSFVVYRIALGTTLLSLIATHHLNPNAGVAPKEPPASDQNLVGRTR